MIDIHINDNANDSIIRSIAETLGIPYEKTNIVVSKLFLPDSVGTGCIQQRTFNSGISVLDVRAKLQSEINLHFDQGFLHPLKIIINKKARLKHQFHDRKDPEYLNEQGSVTLASIAKQKHTVYLPKNQHISLLSIRINRKKMENSVENFITGMNEKLSTLLRDVNGVNPFFYQGYYDYHTTEALHKYFKCNYKNIVENIYLQGLLYELISLQLNTISTDSILSEDQKRVSRSFQEKILKAAKIIKSDIKNFTTVSELSDNINLNVKKIQGGFNELFGVSVLEFVTNYRIEKAQELLLETDLTIAEIGYELGVNSPSYLSKIFKKKTGVTPKEYRLNN